MLIQPFKGLGPGHSLHVSEDNQILWIKMDERNWYGSPLQDLNVIRWESDPPPTGTEFTELCSVPDDAPGTTGFAFVTLTEEDGIGRAEIDILRLRACPYIGIPVENMEFPDYLGQVSEVRVFHLLAWDENSCVGIAYFAHDEEHPDVQVSEDDNVVAVLDILGFSEINDTHPLDELESKIVNGLLGAVQMTSFMTREFIVFDEEGNIPNPSSLSRIGTGVISDTIVLFSRKSAPRPLNSICEAVANMMDCALTIGWLLRGAVDFDSFRVVPDQNIFLGRAMVGAYRLEQSQEWGGCVLSSNIQERFGYELDKMRREGLVVDYDVPIKRSGDQIVPTTMPVINWFYFADSGVNGRRARIESLLQSAPPSAKRKLNYTQDFYSWLEKKKLVSRKSMTMTAFNLEFLDRQR